MDSIGELKGEVEATTRITFLSFLSLSISKVVNERDSNEEEEERTSTEREENSPFYYCFLFFFFTFLNNTFYFPIPLIILC